MHCKSFHKTISLKRVLFTAQGNINIFPLTDFLKFFSGIISLSTIKKEIIQMRRWPLLFLHLMVQEIWLVNSNCIQLSKLYTHTHTHTHTKQLTRQSTDCKNTLTSRAALSSSYLFFDSILSFFNHEILRVFLYINYLDMRRIAPTEVWEYPCGETAKGERDLTVVLTVCIARWSGFEYGSWLLTEILDVSL